MYTIVWSAIVDFGLAKAVTSVNLGLVANSAGEDAAARPLARGRAVLRASGNIPTLTGVFCFVCDFLVRGSLLKR